ncbi:hypothetical protein GOODEAATRI_022921 [Goodea atripinnis]|uniref:Secreted protein n=1 Tax=Goodea atripinnis TaxID=208336 RepID=A0ABV0P747_9TELE
MECTEGQLSLQSILLLFLSFSADLSPKTLHNLFLRLAQKCHLPSSVASQLTADQQLVWSPLMPLRVARFSLADGRSVRLLSARSLKLECGVASEGDHSMSKAKERDRAMRKRSLLQ